MRAKLVQIAVEDTLPVIADNGWLIDRNFSDRRETMVAVVKRQAAWERSARRRQLALAVWVNRSIKRPAMAR